MNMQSSGQAGQREAVENVKPTVLIVDDQPTNIMVLGNALKYDYRVLVATNGKDALEIAETSGPDIILLDIMMPGMDGFSVCSRLKSEDSTRNIPIIFVTSLTNQDEEARGLELGAIDYITKPFSIPIVRARVRNQLELKRRGDLLEKLASIDCLSGIPNRRSFETELEREWRRAKRGGTPLSIFIADIDFFKDYNDFYGHGAGDECIRAVATRLTETLARPGDSVFRYGGEEFAVILPETDFQASQLIGERMRKGVEDLRIRHEPSSISDFVTVSLGGATTIPTSLTQVGTVLSAADQELYAAKRAGRNRAFFIECK